MRRLLASQTVLVTLLGLTMAACGGGGGESEAEREAERGRSEAFAPICEMRQ
jgi:hypothetical protein